MPEVGVLDKTVASENGAEYRYHEVPISKIVELAGSDTLEFVGNGAEVVAVASVKSPDKVRAIQQYRELSPFRAKEQFYSQRIMETLFPHNFPHFYAAFSGKGITDFSDVEEGKQLGGTVRHRIRPQKRTLARMIKDKFGISNVRYPFANVRGVCEQIGIPIDKLIDKHATNFIVGEDGGEYYIDSVTMTNTDLPEHYRQRIGLSNNPFFEKREDILGFMKANGYTEDQIKLVSICIDRLQKLIGTEKE